MNYEYVLIGIGIIVAIILLYYGVTRFLKSKNIEQEIVSTIDINALLEALGGKLNIREVSSSPSKLTVILEDQSAVDVKAIQQLGASGIVEGKESLSMIFGKQSPLIEKDLNARI